jgi:hypothetical protein
MVVWQQPSGGPNVVTNAAVAKMGGINICMLLIHKIVMPRRSTMAMGSQ